MGCESAVIASSVNGLLVGIVVGITLGLIKGLDRSERGIGDWMKELVPQSAVVGIVVGFSHSLLSSCTGLLRKE